MVLLVAATTENPSFSVVSPLLSRSLVLRLEPLTEDDVRTLLRGPGRRAGAGRRGVDGGDRTPEDAPRPARRRGTPAAR